VFLKSLFVFPRGKREERDDDVDIDEDEFITRRDKILIEL